MIKSTDFRLDMGIYYTTEMLAGKEILVRIFLVGGIFIEGKILSIAKGNQRTGVVRFLARPMNSGQGASDRNAPDEISVFDQGSVLMITFLGISE